MPKKWGSTLSDAQMRLWSWVKATGQRRHCLCKSRNKRSKNPKPLKATSEIQYPEMIRSSAPAWNRAPKSKAGQHTRTHTAGRNSERPEFGKMCLEALIDGAPLAKGQHLCATGRRPWAAAAPAPGAHSPFVRSSSSCPRKARPLVAIPWQFGHPIASVFCRRPHSQWTPLCTLSNSLKYNEPLRRLPFLPFRPLQKDLSLGRGSRKRQSCSYYSRKLSGYGDSHEGHTTVRSGRHSREHLIQRFSSLAAQCHPPWKVFKNMSLALILPQMFRLERFGGGAGASVSFQPSSDDSNKQPQLWNTTVARSSFVPGEETEAPRE